MQFLVTIQVGASVIYEAVHEAHGTEPALRSAMEAARKAHPGQPVYLSHVTLQPIEGSASD